MTSRKIVPLSNGSGNLGALGPLAFFAPVNQIPQQSAFPIKQSNAHTHLLMTLTFDSILKVHTLVMGNLYAKCDKNTPGCLHFIIFTWLFQ